MILERGAVLIGRYRIVEILGQGGMGSIYRAVDENLGVEVAVKDNLFTTEEYARQFRREAVILANLRHPNLPRVTDHFVIEQQGQYLVMDYIEGEDLRQRMDRLGNLSEQDIITVGSAICDALNYLHTRNPPIVHRDIKPGNIKITPQGHIFLVDFGLAKVILGSQATTTGARAMTPGYSPPEQYGTARTDDRSDIFSLGATLYAALTGAIPEDAMARMMGQAELTPIRRLNAQVSRRLAATIEKSLEVQPANRYQNAIEFKIALRNSLSTSKRRTGAYHIEPAPGVYDRPIPNEEALPPLPSQNLPVSSPDRSGLNYPVPSPAPAYYSPPQNGSLIKNSKEKNRARSGWLVFGLVGILLVGAILATLYNPNLPSLAFARFLPSSAASFLPVPSQTATPAASSGGQIETASNPVVLPSSPTPTRTNVLVVDVPATATATAQPTATPSPTPTPLPTMVGGGGGQVAFASKITGTNQIYVANLDGSDLRQLTNVKGGACQPEWSPDGSRLVFISPCDSNHDLYPGSSLFIINYDGNGLAALKTIPGGDFDPDWSPDGKSIAFTSLRSSRPQIYVYILEDDTVRLLSAKYAREMQPSWSADGKEIVYISSTGGMTQVWRMNADGSDPTPVSTPNNWTNTNPSLSPDGRLVLLTQLAAPRGIPRMVVATLEGDYTEYRVESQEKMALREGRYSPDGSMMVVEGWGAGSEHNIYILAASGAVVEQVTSQGRINFDPAWRPVTP